MNLREHLQVLDDPTAVAQRAAQFICDAARDAIATRGRFSVALTGGSSPLETYALLAAPAFRDAIDWSRVQLFWGDERAVAPGRAESNYGAANTRLVQHVAIPAGNVHRMEGERSDLEHAASDYAETLRAHCDRTRENTPVVDLILLGIGGDGHILSLFPGCAEITAPSADVVALRDPPMNPALSRISFTPRTLFAARAVLVFAHTAAKAKPLAALLDGPDDPTKLPARLLRAAHSPVTILADRAAITA